MKILWRQMASESMLAGLGIAELCLKQLSLRADKANITTKTHRHSEFEIHFIISGSQVYEVEGREARIDAGSFLMIAPNVQHRVVSSDEDTEKLVLLFQYVHYTNFFEIPKRFSHAVNKTPSLVIDGLLFPQQLDQQKTLLSRLLTENRLLEAVVTLFRAVGFKENATPVESSKTPAVLALAKGYIEDNIERAPSADEVADYCYLSKRQLSRIFICYESKTVFEFIRAKRVERAKELLDDATLSLREISERMGFPNEYYFNQFFKNGYGMPPGAYRKMM